MEDLAQTKRMGMTYPCAGSRRNWVSETCGRDRFNERCVRNWFSEISERNRFNEKSGGNRFSETSGRDQFNETSLMKSLCGREVETGGDGVSGRKK